MQPERAPAAKASAFHQLNVVRALLLAIHAILTFHRRLPIGHRPIATMPLSLSGFFRSARVVGQVTWAPTRATLQIFLEQYTDESSDAS